MKKTSIFALVVIASFVSRDAEAQSIASRVANVRDGKVRFTYAARPDVCGFGNSISRGGGSRINWSSSDSPDVLYDEECSHSPVRIVLNVNDGRIEKLRTYVGGRWRPATSEIVDLGTVSTREATGYLLTLAAREKSSVGEQAILPLTLADSVVIWPQLFKIARDPDTPKKTQRQAVFWISQAAGEAVAPDRYEKSRESEDSEIRKQAVFAISQRKRDDSVPALIQIARNNKDPEVRKSALFWLGQSGDPRAITLFEEILSK